MDAGRPGGAGRDGRGGRHRGRLRQPRPLPALARLLDVTASSRATTSSATTPTPTTTTATARTSRARSPRARATRVGLTGLAYGVKLMPVKVLDRDGEGDSARIAQGIRWAADHGAKIINLSFEFPSDITRSQIPNILDAIRHAKRQGRRSWSAPRATPRPPRSPTRRARATSSRSARRPSTAARPTTPTRARTSTSSPPAAASTTRSTATRTAARPRPPGLDIFQMTFSRTNGFRRFGLPSGFIGTSMAAPHVSATAALVVASGILGPDPTPDAIERRLETDRARPRPARPGPALRRGPAQRRGRDGPGDPGHLATTPAGRRPSRSSG